MLSSTTRALGRLILGQEARLRLRLSRNLLAGLVFLFSLGMQWFAVFCGLADAGPAARLTGLIMTGLLLFYMAIRSGWSERLADPALTLPQMIFAITSLALAYHVNPPVRGVLLMVVALVLMFGAFILTPPQCRRLGWLALGLLGLVMLSSGLFEPETFAPLIELIHFAFAFAVLLTVSVLAGQLSRARFEQRQQKLALRDALAHVKVLATRDELTGLPNRRYFLEMATREAARCERLASPICLAILDLDHFKRINDTHGHGVGDQVLARFAQGASICLRDVDLLARWGGEEFVLMMPDTSLAVAGQVLDRLRAHLSTPEYWQHSGAGVVSFSAGLTDWRVPERINQAIERADNAMYQAKLDGRDRWCSQGGDDAPPAPPVASPMASA